MNFLSTKHRVPEPPKRLSDQPNRHRHRLNESRSSAFPAYSHTPLSRAGSSGQLPTPIDDSSFDPSPFIYPSGNDTHPSIIHSSRQGPECPPLAPRVTRLRPEALLHTHWNNTARTPKNEAYSSHVSPRIASETPLVPSWPTTLRFDRPLRSQTGGRPCRRPLWRRSHKPIANCMFVEAERRHPRTFRRA